MPTKNQILILIMTLLVVCARSQCSASQLYVGAATVSITPDGPVSLSGQMHTRIARKVESEVTATVLVLESRDGDRSLDHAIMVSCDLVCIRGGIHEAVRERLRKQLKDVDVNKVILNATHTHTAPTMIQGRYHLPKEGVMQPTDYVKFASRQIADAVVKAWTSRERGSAGWGLGHAVIAHNRRALYADGHAQMYGKTNTNNFRGIEGYEDHGVEVLFFWNQQKELLATAINIGCPSQAVEGRSAVNADFWHPVRQALRAKYGKNLHVLGWAGAAGDHVPRPMYRKKAEARMQKLRGLTPLEEISRRVVAGWEEAYEGAKQETHDDAVLVHKVKTIELPLRTVTEADYNRVKTEVARYAKDPQKIWIKNWKQSVLDRYERQQAGTVKPYKMELHSIRLGDIAIATNDFELFNDFGTQMKSRSPALQTFVIQLCGPGTYVPTERAVRGGSYSAVVESSIVGPVGGQVLTERTIDSIKELFAVPKPLEKMTAKPIEAAPVRGDWTPPMSPAESLAATHVRDGFEIELVATEPLVKDPVAIAWGPDGKLWVTEMADYPLGIDGKGKPGGRIRVLTDTNGDGKYDQSTLFLDGIRFPNGVLPWRNGVLVTAAPEIIYAEDTNGDGRADKREVLFAGFQEGNQQLRVNGLRWGLDNWIYCASGAHHGGYGADRRIRSIKTGKAVDLGSRDFRFRPDTGEIDPQSGPSQFGRSRDDWGNWFGEQNSHPLWHFVLQDHYLRRNPHFAPPDPRKQLVVPSNPRVYPAKSPQKRFHSFEQSGRFTSACSAMVYRDEFLFPRDQTQHAFTCEPFHNLVQHNLITNDGVSFSSHRDPAEADVDFFASKDRWCRPVQIRTGPDGALWVVDMYRYMIEHPQWLTPQGREELKPFYRSGDDRGRIYRVFPKGQRTRGIRNLDKLPTDELVAALDSPNGSQRDSAQQMLFWREDKSAVDPLERMVKECLNPLARLHALCTLDGLNALSPELVELALHDKHAGVRRHAIRLAEPLAERHRDLLTTAVKLADDPDAQVRLQLACSLGEWNGRDSARALTQLAIKDAPDPYLTAAVTSSISKQNIDEVLSAVIAEVTRIRNDPKSQDITSANPARANAIVGRLLALSVAFEHRAATLNALEAILRFDKPADLSWHCDTVAGLLDALERRQQSLDALHLEQSNRGKALLQQIVELTEHAHETTFDSQATPQLRVAAVRLLARNSDTQADDIAKLSQLLTPQTPPEIQLAVVRHLGSRSALNVAQAVLSGWRSHGPSLRSEIISVLVTRKAWLTKLLDDIEAGHMARADIDAATRLTLSVYPDKSIRSRVARLFAEAGNADRQAVIRDHQPALTLTGSPTRGASVFKKTCAACHKLDGVGHDIGPNLRSITDRKPVSLLTSILDPSASVDGKYVTYIAVTEDGRTFTGMMASEAGNSITLVAQENKRHVILRNQLEEIVSTGKSMMPDGLEKDRTHQDFADLIAYIREPKQVTTTPDSTAPQK